MNTEPANIKFRNAQRPGESFDLIRLEDLYSRTNLDHSPFEFHRVEFFIILLIEEGTGSHVIDFTEHPFSPGTVITIRQNQIHRFVRNQKAKGSMLLFTSEFIWRYLEHQEALRSIQLFNEMLGSPKVQLSEEERKDCTDPSKNLGAG